MLVLRRIVATQQRISFRGLSYTAASSSQQPQPIEVDPFTLVNDELKQVMGDVSTRLQSVHPSLTTSSEYYFNLKGKQVRPVLILLMARAANAHRQIVQRKEPIHIATERQRPLAAITEMIHIASLMHDDVLDLSDTRRNVQTVNATMGNRFAVFSGDYMLAKSSIWLSQLHNHEATMSMSTAISNLVEGELLQMRAEYKDSTSMEYYIQKTYLKTGALMAQSCKAVAELGDHDDYTRDIAFNYAKHFGIAYQIMDDYLDYVGSSKSLGKPALNDISNGLVTAPLLLALPTHPELLPLIERKFRGVGDIDKALECVNAASAIEKTKKLAETHRDLAVRFILQLRQSPARDALVTLASFVIDRMK
eukprot:TRINITY_DN10314_c0_g1_i1.p1 TRINITY_DN10314_c0_g1~~TRINITY_DN10314_c0_g1_i1.p1  ORF type:complete len:364 (+),score=95.88 TRINITY_DN10314_c0_g1_i1:59-1150(+)